MAEKLDKNILGTQITDELHNSVGAGFCALDHDTFFGALDMRICTAAGGGGVTLIENTDYTLHDTDAVLTAECSKNVYTTYKIINPVYQACDFFFTYKTVGDYREAYDANIIGDMLPKVADYTVPDHDRNPTILVTTGAVDRTITLPTAADNTGKIITVIKADSGAGIVTVDGEGAETIDGDASVIMVSQYDYVTMLCTGTAWIILSIYAHRDTGWVDCNDWTNQHLGDAVGANLNHKLGIPLRRITRTRVVISTDGADANSFTAMDFMADAAVGNFGIQCLAVDDNNIIVHTGSTGLLQCVDATGLAVAIDIEAYKYRVIAERRK